MPGPHGGPGGGPHGGGPGGPRGPHHRPPRRHMCCLLPTLGVIAAIAAVVCLIVFAVV